MDTDSDRKQFIQRYLPRNFALIALDGVLFFLGMIFLHLENVIPVLITNLGGTNFHVGLIPVIQNLGIFLPSIFIAAHVQSLTRKKKYLLIAGTFQRIPWLIGGFGTLFLASAYPALAVWLVLLSVFFSAVGAGFTIPAFFYITGKVIPVNSRGKLFALRNMGSYALGLGGGFLLKVILNNNPFPMNFSILIFLGWFLLMLSVPCVLLMKEPDAIKTIPNPGLKKYLSTIPGIIQRNRGFQRFIFGRVIYAIAYSCTAYFAVTILSRYNREPGDVGIFTVIITATYIIVNPFLGFISDKWGHKINMIIGSAALVLSNLVLLFAPSYLVSLSAFIFSSTALACRMTSEFAMTMEYCNENEIPTFIGISGLFIASASIFIAILGKISELFGVTAVFIITLILSILCAFIFLFIVREPRHSSRGDHIAQ